ncbi:hypothetical protein BG22_00290 [Bifidobacterium sp. UTBIF-78]|nr:hypothetical protein BG22_00290 [Bifidobacterium sp. UTBIF-78]
MYLSLSHTKPLIKALYSGAFGYAPSPPSSAHRYRLIVILVFFVILEDEDRLAGKAEDSASRTMGGNVVFF